VTTSLLHVVKDLCRLAFGKNPKLTNTAGTVFLPRDAMHSDDNAMAIMSVCPSVCRDHILCLNGSTCIVKIVNQSSFYEPYQTESRKTVVANSGCVQKS